MDYTTSEIARICIFWCKSTIISDKGLLRNVDNSCSSSKFQSLWRQLKYCKLLSAASHQYTAIILWSISKAFSQAPHFNCNPAMTEFLKRCIYIYTTGIFRKVYSFCNKNWSDRWWNVSLKISLFLQFMVKKVVRNSSKKERQH